MTSVELLLSIAVLAAVQVALAVWVRGAIRGARGARRVGEGVAAVAPSADAVATEIAKRQVAVLSEMVEELRDYDHACLAHARRFCEVTLAEMKRAGMNGVPDALPQDLDSAIRTIGRLGGHTLDAAAQARIRKDVEPNTTVLLASAGQATNRLGENRFWLGLALEGELRTYVAAMAGTFADLNPSPDALRLTEQRYLALLKGHPEAARAIERLSALAG